MENNEEQEGNEIQRRATQVELKDCNDLERKAIEWRYQGRTHGEISREIGYHETSVRKLFMANGRLEKAYDQYAAIQMAKNEQNLDAALATAKAEVTDALQRVIAISKQPLAKDALKANELLLEISGLTGGAGLREIIRKMGRERAREEIGAIFLQEFGENISKQIVMMPAVKVRDHEGNLKDLEFRIGDRYLPKDPEAS